MLPFPQGRTAPPQVIDGHNSTVDVGSDSFEIIPSEGIENLVVTNYTFSGYNGEGRPQGHIINLYDDRYSNLNITLKDITISGNKIWSQGGLIITSGNIVCDNVIFENNDGNSIGFNANIWARNRLVIKNSQFRGNKSNGDAAALYAGYYSPIGSPLLLTTLNSVTDSVFENNINKGYSRPDLTAYGGAIGFDFPGSENLYLPNNIRITDSSFKDNSVSGGKGGAIGIRLPKDSYSIYIEAINKDVYFSENKQDPNRSGTFEPNDIYIEKGILYLNSATGKTIFINSGIEGRYNPRKSYLFFNYYANGIVEIGEQARINRMSTELCGGTLTLKNPLAFENSKLKITGSATINTINNKIQKNLFYDLRTKSGILTKLMVDVDLANKKADEIETSNSMFVIISDVHVSHWNILANSNKEQVIVHLTDQPLLYKNLGLEDSALTAVYSDRILRSTTTWLVKYLTSEDSDDVVSGIDGRYKDNGHFLFYQPHTDPDPIDPDPIDPNPTDPEPTDPEPTPEPTPVDFNPDLYQGSVAIAGMGVIQHAITNSLFSDFGNRSADGVLLEEPPVHNPWWVKVLGSDFDMKPKNFSSLDLKYSIAMIGHDFDPMHLGNDGKLYCGVYGGWAGAKHEFESSHDVKQNGAFIGLNALYTKGNFHVSGHLNVGKMYNDYSSDFGSLDNQNNWLGAGVNASYFLDLPTYRTVVRIGVTGSFVRINADDFTTQRGVDVHMSDVDSREISPGFTVTKFFDHGWKASATARYAWVDESNDGIRVPEYGPLPAIGFDDYVEYGAGIQKQSKDDLWTLDLLRSDKGRRGFSVQLRYGWRF